MAQTYNKILTKGYYSALGTTPTEDGKLRFTVDTGQLFLDNQNERIEITDFVKGQTEEEIRTTLAPLPKFYYASDTKRFLVYVDGEWEIVAEKNSDTVQNASSATYAQNANLAEEATHAVNADHATNADTATYANDAGNAENANHASNADNATNASSAAYATNAGNAENADHATSADNADEATHATTADNATNAATATYAKNAGTAAQATNAINANHATSADSADEATHADSADHATSADSATNATSATNAATATYAKNAGTATRATNANHATNADNADEAAHATNADTATYAKNAGTATRATNANHATEADNADYATNAGTATRATADGNGRNIVSTYAPLNSPIFSGTPTAPTAASGSSSTQIANTAFVTRAVAEAIGGVTQFQIAIYDTFEDLPGTGTAGTIYFVKNNSEEENNAYDEYIWTGSAYELMGTVKIDLSNYVNAVDISGTGNAVTGMQKSGNKLTLTKSATFLTQHPSVSKNSSTFAERPAAGSTMSVVDNVTVDNYGHLTNYRRKTVTLPNSVDNADHATNADTATYARNAGSSTNARNASSADFADNAGTATRATGDSAGDNIRNTYIKSASVSGKTVTFTRGNGSTFSITTQDNNTTYANMRGATGTAGGAAGLVPAPASGNNDDFLRGDGKWAIPAKATNADTATYARNAGTATRASTATYAVNAGTATRATGDSAGDNIRNTYIKNASVSGRTVTFTKGNGSTFSITTQDNNTTYSAMRGATSAAAGGAGLVPAPAAGNHDDFLRGDGKWAIPAKATNADTATYARNAGTATQATNATSATNAATATYARNAGTAATARGFLDVDFDFGDLDE